MTIPPDECTFIIKKPEGSNKWIVVAEPAGSPKPMKGTKLFWRFDNHYTGLEAHFQFTSHIPGNDEICIVENYDSFTHITPDWTGSIPGPQGEDFLTGRLHKNVPNRAGFYFAVWIVDPRGVNDFAIGENPPPKIETDG
jgi:hypothetical protein